MAVIGVCFAYGLRKAGPLLLGSLGWAFGQAAQAMLGNLKHVEGWLLAVLVLLGLGWWGWQRRKS